MLLALSAVASAGTLPVKDGVSAPGDFPFVVNGRAAPILVDKDDAEVVRIAADLLATDVERVTGVKPKVGSDVATTTAAPMVIVGTLGKSDLIADLVRRGKLDIRGIKGQWESFIVATVADPFPRVASALVIVGSDRRGTAYGVFEVSEAIGVSPWVWWADVAPRHRERLVIGAGTHTQGPPSVKYRGIFINDEDWGLQPWAAKTFEPETEDIGPKTYAKVCELLLRLKANYLWPAMHPCTKAFNHYPENKRVADRYAIVMGSSHCEQMLRNNVDEWDKEKYGDWNPVTNLQSILEYWETRVRENGKFDNVYTVGMRGIHDGAMPGGGTIEEKRQRMEKIIGLQREMLARHVNPDPSQVPQIFCPYKEVLDIYQLGLELPGDVTIVWPDDNHGYIRQLPNAAEQKRRGGSGVYYHVSYWGDPADYLWLCTTPPALIWEEMHKAYEQGARTLWVLNVGDIKPAEIDMEFFLRMAWDIRSWDENAQSKFLPDWAARNFGPAQAGEIAAALDEYYRLNYPAKPEHLHRTQFTNHYGEIDERLRRFSQLVKNVDALYKKLPREKRDAFYELVVYPVRGSALMNEKYLGASLEQRQKAHEQIQDETKGFNNTVAGGKWRGIMSASPRNQPAFKKPDSQPTATAAIASGAQDSTVSIEAEHPTRKTDADAARWKVIAGLGRTGDSIELLPTTGGVSGAMLEYDFTATKAGPAKVLVTCIPTHALHSGAKLRYSVSIDGEAPKVVDLDTREFSREWSVNVLRGAAIGTTEHAFERAGRHTLTLRALDPGVVFDKIVIDLGDMKPSQLGPRETTLH
jgi:hypothetical protein